MIVPFSVSFKDNVSNFAYQKNIFTKEECERIIELGESLKPEESFVGVKSKSKKDSSFRSSRTAWITFNVNTQWIYSRIAESVIKLNDEHFQFDIRGFGEPIQFTHYEAKKKGQFKSHQDSVNGIITRKLSVSIQLSPDNYKGGELEIMTGSHPKDRFKMTKEQGSIIIFPSYMLHQVLPIKKGQRYSLVSWITGPSLK